MTTQMTWTAPVLEELDIAQGTMLNLPGDDGFGGDDAVIS